MNRLAISILLTCLASAAEAEIAASGKLTATKACPAYQSFRQATNPGEVRLEPGRAYAILAKNNEPATHYRIQIDGASPAERWVEISCGAVAPGADPATPAAGGATHVLALSWEPAFCRSHANKTECTGETAGSPEAKRLSLHGLWPQPIGKAYCGVEAGLRADDKSRDWSDLPEPAMQAETRARLAAVMPGVQSGLERHEWLRHGTCFGATADVYFNRAAGLAEAVNGSAVRELFAGRVGQSVSALEIRAAFDKSFGAGAGGRVEVHCQGRGEERLIGELIVSLAGAVNGDAALADLIAAAPPVAPGCPGGKVAAAGR